MGRSPSGVEEEQGRGDDITDNRDQNVQSTSSNFRENQIPGGSEYCRERHYTMLEKLLSAVGIPENLKKNADNPEGNRLGTETFHVLCFCCLVELQETFVPWEPCTIGRRYSSCACWRSKGLKNRGRKPKINWRIIQLYFNLARPRKTSVSLEIFLMFITDLSAVGK